MIFYAIMTILFTVVKVSHFGHKISLIFNGTCAFPVSRASRARMLLQMPLGRVRFAVDLRHVGVIFAL